jgi:predicted nucleotidyltransferase
MNITEYLDEIVPVLKASVDGRYAVALAGAHAKGHWDESSDIDIFLLVDALKPLEQRRALVEALGGSNLYFEEKLDQNAWGSSMDFSYKGVPVETTVRSIQHMESTVAACAAGKFNVQMEIWTIHGYYDFVYLSEASFLKPIDDPWDVLARIKAMIMPYPQAFRQAALDYFLPRAGFWMENFHYLSAIERCDYVYTSGILQQSFHNLVQALFPLNERFFTGDKRIATQLAELSFCPRPLLDQLDFILGTARKVEDLRQQRALFMQACTETRDHSAAVSTI